MEKHILKDLIEYGLDKANQLGYKACLVEGTLKDISGYVDYDFYTSLQ